MPNAEPARRDHGQVLPLCAALLVVAAAVALVVADLGAAAIARARARTAADAAALAGAAEGEAAARAMAADNGAELVSFTADGSTVVVGVRLDDARARATAEGARRGAGLDGLAPATAAAVARAAQLLRRPVPVVAVLDGGTAVEVAPELVEALVGLASESGLCQQAPAARPVHFAPCPPISPG